MLKKIKIIIIGASGTIGSYLSNTFEKEHEIIRANRNSTGFQVDITSPASIENMYKKAGTFDALICTAGPTHVGPW